MGENKQCLGCMEKKGAVSVCPHCGYVEGTPYLPSYIEPGTTLHNRYTVGKLLSSNGEGATYIGYDTVITCKIVIREYMPENLCSRVKGKPIISVNYNHLAQYKALMAEFTELNKSLAKMRTLSHIVPALDLFSENNTTYAIYEFVECISLIDYLKENAGELSWEQVSKLFPPLFTTLSIIHNTGIIHRGISPNTIYYTPKGELKLMEFCVSGVRTANTELVSEIFQGYAAPEQYSLSSRQGTWTDVYGICAVLYRILTGCMPTDALSRVDNDNLCPPHEINTNVPKNISLVIMDGLKLVGRERIQTITELVTRLFEQLDNSAKSFTATITIPKSKLDAVLRDEKQNNKQVTPIIDDVYEDEIDGTDVSQQSSLERIKVAVIIGVLLLAILMVLVTVFLNFLNGDDTEKIKSGVDSLSSLNNVVTVTTTTDESTEVTTESTEETTTIVKDSLMPSLIGKSFEIQKTAHADWITLEPVYEYNNDYGNGLIYEQEIKEGEKFSSGSTVKVWVSKGSENVVIPSFAGLKLDDYLQKLDASGIRYEQKPEENHKYENGYVTGTSKEPGSTINVKNGDILIVSFAENPEVTTAKPDDSGGNDSQGETLQADSVIVVD